MSSHLLSVVMPTHNRADQLEGAARSVLEQCAVEIELVIVDDASSDHTTTVTDRLSSDRRVRVLRNEQSVGPGAARNQGIRVTRGDLLGFCDDDDAWLPRAASTLTDCLSDRAELGAVTSWHRVVHDGTARCVDFRGPLEFGPDELLWFNVVALPFGIVRRSHFDEDPAFDETLPPCEDWDLWLRCAQARPIAAVPSVLYEYRQHGGPRVTTKGSRGRQAFVEKHWSEMTPACRVYHRACLAHEASGRSAMAGTLASSATGAPVAAAFAGAVLGTTDVAASWGIRRADPGLASRAVVRLLSLDPARRGRRAAG